MKCSVVVAQTMSRKVTLNLVEDEEMSSQGSVNASVKNPRVGGDVQTPMCQQYDTPSGLHPWPASPMAQIVGASTPGLIQQSSVGIGLNGL